MRIQDEQENNLNGSTDSLQETEDPSPTSSYTSNEENLIKNIGDKTPDLSSLPPQKTVPQATTSQTTTSQTTTSQTTTSQTTGPQITTDQTTPHQTLLSPEEQSKLKQQLEAAEKKYRYYARRYDNLLKQTQLAERLKDNYEEFYQSALEELKEKQKNLDQKNSELATLNKRLESIALSDALTKLPNRKMFEIRLQQALRDSLRQNECFCLLFIDLDGFKDINDTFGHSAGDDLLITIAQRLQMLLRGNDTLARLGGDEFVIIGRDTSNQNDAVFIADRIIKACNQPIQWRDQKLLVSASIGIAFYPNDVDPIQMTSASGVLQQYADLAMYKAKQLGKNQYCFYDQGMTEKSRKDLTRSLLIREDIGHRRFLPFFQPLFNAKSNHIIGFEALARWPMRQNASRFHTPLEFFPLVKRMNLIPEIDFLILEKVCCFIRRNPKLIKKIDYISVNFSVETFSETNCFERFKRTLEKYDVQPNKITVEITEKSLLNENSLAALSIKHIEKLGAKISLDDFGTGYSALSYLNRLPIDTIKIDRYFIQNLPHDGFSKVIVCHLVRLARELNFNLVAEGIETQPQMDFLIEEGCNILQGFYFSPPMPESALESYLSEPFSVALPLKSS